MNVVVVLKGKEDVETDDGICKSYENVTWTETKTNVYIITQKDGSRTIFPYENLWEIYEYEDEEE